jgi:hypothetical protein
MEKSKIDWSVIKLSIITFSICLVVGCSLVFSSYYFSNKLSLELNQNKRLFLSVSRRYIDVDQEEKLLQEYFPQFVALYNRGIIGREKRLNWIEALRQSGEKINLPSLRYSINSQEEFVPEFPINYAGYAIYSSSMQLNLGLLHEGDLFELLSFIDNNAEGLYTISECSFSKASSEVIFDKNVANISAACQLEWMTLDLPGGYRIKI